MRVAAKSAYVAAATSLRFLRGSVGVVMSVVTVSDRRYGNGVRQRSNAPPRNGYAGAGSCLNRGPVQDGKMTGGTWPVMRVTAGRDRHKILSEA